VARYAGLVGGRQLFVARTFEYLVDTWGQLFGRKDIGKVFTEETAKS